MSIQKKTFTRPFYVSAAHLMGREGIMFPGCPSVCACVRARVAAFSDRLLVLNVLIITIFFTVLQRCTRGCGGCLPLNQAQSLIDWSLIASGLLALSRLLNTAVERRASRLQRTSSVQRLFTAHELNWTVLKQTDHTDSRTVHRYFWACPFFTF